MLKNLLGGAAALGLMSQIAVANSVIINGVPQQAGGTITVPYGTGGACCVEEIPYTPLPVLGHSSAMTTHSSAPMTTYSSAPMAIPASAPTMSTVGAPVVTHVGAPVVTHVGAPVVTHTSAPVVTHTAAPMVTHSSAPMTYETMPVVSEEIVYMNEAPAIMAPAASVPVVMAPASASSYVAQTPEKRGWNSRVYVGARGGWSALRDTGFRVGAGSVSNDYDNAGYNAAAVIGWGAKVENSIGYRVEAEFGYQSAEIDSHRVGGTRFGSEAFGETNTLYGFANAYLDIPVVNRLNAVVGGGAGLGKVEFDAHGIDVAGVGRVMDDEDTVFGYHLDAGLSFDVTDQLALEAMYRYTSFVDVELTSRDGEKDETNVDSHNVVVGARYGF